MNRFAVLCMLMFALLFSACQNNINSSVEEARYVLTHQEDFLKELQYIKIKGEGLGYIHEPLIVRTEPEALARSANQGVTYITHFFLYESKSHSFCYIIMGDARPPKPRIGGCYVTTPHTTTVDPNVDTSPQIHPADTKNVGTKQSDL